MLPPEGISSDNISNAIQFSSVTQSCLTFCDPMNQSTPGLLVHYQLPGSTQIHVHRVNDAIQLSHPLSFPSPPAFNLSQHQGLFQRVRPAHHGGQSIGASASASVLPMNIKRLISFRIEWFGFLAVQGTLKSLLPHHSFCL